jgi:hypothetical protein
MEAHVHDDPMVDLVEERDTAGDIPGDIPEVSPESNGHQAGAAGSVWEQIQAKRAQLAGDRFIDLEVPGTFGLFALRLGPISGQRQAALTDRMQKSRSPDRDFNLNADYLIAACRGLLGRDDPEAPLVELTDASGEPLRLDRRTAEAFRLPEQTTARELLRHLFAGVPSPSTAVNMTVVDYLQWASGMTSDLDEEALGEA